MRIDYRIGVNLGDVMIDAGDIAGDGVNVASRLESLAEPGAICVSASVREQVHGNLDVEFKDIGDQRVKNITRAIRAFAIDVDPRPRARAVARWPFRIGSHLQRRRVGAVLVILALIAAWPFWRYASAPEPMEPPAMSVGVLPLRGAGGEMDASRRADALTRDLGSLLALSDVAIRVVPIDAFAVTQNGGDRRSLARAGNVRYVVDGDVNDTAEALTARLRLVDARSGELVWDESVSLARTSNAEAGRALRRSMEHLRSALLRAEMQRVGREAGNRVAMDYVLRAIALEEHEIKTLDVLRHEEVLYDAALRLDVDSVPALLGLTRVLDSQLDVDDNVDRERLVRRMDELTSRAATQNRNAPEVWAARSSALMFMGRWEAALEADAKAMQLDPGAAWLVARHGWSLSMVGQPALAVAAVAQAVAMDPPGSWWTIRAGCEAHLLLGQYDEAIAMCERALGQAGNEFDIAWFLASAYAHKGMAERAAQETAKILRRSPGFTIAKLRGKRYSAHPEYLKLADEHWYSGLRQAGIPEQ
jgi:tetratricopeptide (TPR) repeat protein